MKWNRLFNLLTRYRREAADESLENQIQEVSESFVFEDKICLRTTDPFWGSPEYAFSAHLKEKTRVGDVTAYEFSDLERVLDIPYLEVEARIPVKSFDAYRPPEPVDTARLTSQTRYWPAEDREVTAITDTLVGSQMPVEQHVETILNGVNANIQFGGDVAGSRYGVKRVLGQGYGRCWDKSDVFITLCRSAGFPARQVGGWLRGVGGHMWAEVYVAGSGWIPVDATASWLGVSSDYIPFFISEAGDAPLVYWGVPQIVREPLGRTWCH